MSSGPATRVEGGSGGGQGGVEGGARGGRGDGFALRAAIIFEKD